MNYYDEHIETGSVEESDQVDRFHSVKVHVSLFFSI